MFRQIQTRLLASEGTTWTPRASCRQFDGTCLPTFSMFAGVLSASNHICPGFPYIKMSSGAFLVAADGTVAADLQLALSLARLIRETC